jgi:hypothetical protein
VISGTKLREKAIQIASGKKRIAENLWYNQCFFPCNTFSNNFNSPITYFYIKYNKTVITVISAVAANTIKDEINGALPLKP